MNGQCIGARARAKQYSHCSSSKCYVKVHTLAVIAETVAGGSKFIDRLV